MKRALAERAKQSLPQPAVAEPSKVPRLDLSTSVTTTDPASSSSSTEVNAVVHAPAASVPSSAPPSPAKRQKRISSLASQVINNQDDSSFYLKHQNRALATELLSLQDSTKALEKERDYRRQECWAACQALNSLQATWTQLETALTDSPSPPLASMMDSGAPTLTGTGMEWTRALAEALAGLGRQRSTTDSTDQFYSDLSQLSANVTTRANTLQECIWKTLNSSPPSNSAIENAQHEKELAESKMQVRFLETEVAELTQARDQIASKERKLRRNFYRLSVGILTTEQAMQTLDQDGDEEWLQVRLETRDRVKQEDDYASASATSNNVSQAPVDAAAIALSESKNAQYETKIADLEAKLRNRDVSIDQLTGKLKEKELLVNQLSLSQQSEQDAEKLQSFEATCATLNLKEERILELESELEKTREKWAQAVGNEKVVLASIEEQLKKFEKRWSEFSDDSVGNGETNGAVPVSGIASSNCAKAKTISELEHKLSQALENVRQSETVRSALAEALEMNQELQSKLEELKSRYTTLQAKTNSTPPAKPDIFSTSNEVDVSSDSGMVEKEKYERVYKDHRKARKEISTLNSKLESFKAKLERVDKDRDAILATNSRLLQQITEKDEMNAKSLSTILHLKSLTEQLKLENDNLEQQSKSASQLALASRLASNAKARVSEEMVKERELLEEKLLLAENETARIKNELIKLSSDLSEGSGKVSSLQSKFENSVKRCDELVSEIEAKDEEIRRLLDSLNQTEREAHSAKENLNKIMQGSTGGDVREAASSFTVEQLNTHISVLKDRLACPVCHYRDKECIIMRCRHMHCKQCVDERISNRSRKCPTCNNKFSEKDVEDIWLS